MRSRRTAAMSTSPHVGIYYMEPSAPAYSYADSAQVYLDITETYELKMEALKVINRTQATVYDYYGSLARARGREAAFWRGGAAARCAMRRPICRIRRLPRTVAIGGALIKSIAF